MLLDDSNPSITKAKFPFWSVLEIIIMLLTIGFLSQFGSVLQ